MSYSTFSNFGKNSSQGSTTNPLSVCAVPALDAGFNNQLAGNGILSPESSQCIAIMPMICSQNWNGVCEYMSNDTNRALYNPQQNNILGGSCGGSGIGSLLTKGQMLIRNTASEKYLVAMSDNCHREYEPFDPTAADSPLISRWVSNTDAPNACIPIYAVDPHTIDSDPLMHKLLDNPVIGMDILINIYNNAKANNRLHHLNNTRLGNFFSKSFSK